MNLTCSACKEEKEEFLFHKNSTKPTGRASYCKECAKKYYRSWQDTNPETRKRFYEWKLARVERNRKTYLEYMSDKSCLDCGETNVLVLDHDHVRGDKQAGVLFLVRQGLSWKKIQDEMKKCEIRCKNCHAIKTANEQGWWMISMGVCENSGSISLQN